MMIVPLKLTSRTEPNIEAVLNTMTTDGIITDIDTITSIRGLFSNVDNKPLYEINMMVHVFRPVVGQELKVDEWRFMEGVGHVANIPHCIIIKTGNGTPTSSVIVEAVECATGSVPRFHCVVRNL